MANQKQVKNMRRALRKNKNRLVMSYVKDNYSAVIGASVSMIQSFKFRDRLFFAMKILFERRRKANEAAEIQKGN